MDRFKAESATIWFKTQRGRRYPSQSFETLIKNDGIDGKKKATFKRRINQSRNTIHFYLIKREREREKEREREREIERERQRERERKKSFTSVCVFKPQLLARAAQLLADLSRSSRLERRVRSRV